MIKVLVVDDLPVVRLGVKKLLSAVTDVEIVGEAATGEEAVAAVDELDPDIVLMDVGMPGMNGIDASRLIRKRNTKAKIIMLTSHDAQMDVLGAFAAGADGYVLKDRYETTLELAIRTVGFNSVWLDPAIARRVLEIATCQKSTTEQSWATPEATLSVEEETVLKKVAHGNCENGVCLVEPSFVEKLRRFSKPSPA